MSGSAQALVDELRRELAPLETRIRSHAFLRALEVGEVGEDRLRAFAGEQCHVLRSDRRSFAQLAARYPDDLSGSVFLALAAGEDEALHQLHGFATALGLSNETLAAYEPQPGCQAYAHFVAWLALNGSRLDVAIAFLANLDVWGANCARMRQALAHRYQLAEDALGLFDYFATPSTSLREQITTVANAGLTAGDPPTHARRAARLLQAYELLFWDTINEPHRTSDR
jgi:thiaminase